MHESTDQYYDISIMKLNRANSVHSQLWVSRRQPFGELAGEKA